MILLRFIFIVLLAGAVALFSRVLWLYATMLGVGSLTTLAPYIIIAVAAALYWAARWLIKKYRMGWQNLKWLETFSHELTHTVVSLLTLRQVHNFRAGSGTGQILSSGGDFTLLLVSLAPYCQPIYTWFFLILRPIILPEFLWIVDVLLGVTLGFHITCFVTQTGNYQTDINRYPLIISYLCITVALIFNTCVIIDALQPGSNVFKALWHVLRDSYPL